MSTRNLPNTGLLLLFIGNAIIVGDYRAIIAVLLVFVSLWFKLKKEENLLIETFGTEYVEYKNRTKALIPYLLWQNEHTIVLAIHNLQAQHT